MILSFNPPFQFPQELIAPLNADCLFFILIGYLSGSILFAYLLPRLFKHIDIRTLSDDGNPGTANAFLHAGIPTGILVILLELLKGFLPVWFACRQLPATDFLFPLVIAAPVLGHAFPFFWKGRHGGKSIAVSFGVLLGLCPNLTPVLTLAFFYLVFSLVIVIRPHLFRSILTYLCFCISCVYSGQTGTIVIACCLIGALVIFKHLSAYHGEHFTVALLHTRKSG